MTSATDTTAPHDVAAITAALQGFVPVLEDADPRQRAYIYTEDATFVMPGAPLVQGRTEMLRRLERGTLLRSVTITPSVIEARDDLAYAYGLFTCVQDERPVTLRFLMVLRKEADGAWRIAREFLAAESPTMAHDREHIEQLARSYTEAWCSRDPALVAGHYISGGTIAINGGDATGIADVAEAFIAAFPDIQVFMDDLVIRENSSVEYRWTFTGTSAETGKSVRVPGYEEWTIAPDGLIAESRGHYDQAEYDRQLQHGFGAGT